MGGAAGAVGNLITSALIPGWLSQFIASAVAYLIIAVAVIIALFRTLFTLIMCWISIILSVVFAPLQLLLNALPNVNTFGAWLKNLIANALVFPAVGILLLVGVALVGGDRTGELGVRSQNNNANEGWVPPLIMDPDASGASRVQAIIGLGIILILPEIAKVVKGALGAEDKLGLGEAAMGSFQKGQGALSGLVKAPFQLGANALTYGRYIAEGAEILSRQRKGVSLRNRLKAFLPPEYGAARTAPQKPVQPIDTTKEPPVIDESEAH